MKVSPTFLLVLLLVSLYGSLASADTMTAASSVEISIENGNPTWFSMPTNSRWVDAYSLCDRQGKRLCSNKQVCRNGHSGKPVGGIIPGDTWVPTRDLWDDWLSVGDFDLNFRKCRSHSSMFGMAWWTNNPWHHFHFRRGVFCCDDDRSKAVFEYHAENFGSTACSTIAVVNPSDRRRSASRTWSNVSPGHCCNAGTLHSGCGWCAAVNAGGEWYQIDAGRAMSIAGVVTQGRSDADQRVTQFYIATSLDGQTWSNVDNTRIFGGNYDHHTQVRNFFSTPVIARYVRFVIVSCHGHCSMRAAILGCSFDWSDSSGNDNHGRVEFGNPQKVKRHFRGMPIDTVRFSGEDGMFVADGAWLPSRPYTIFVIDGYNSNIVNRRGTTVHSRSDGLNFFFGHWNSQRAVHASRWGFHRNEGDSLTLLVGTVDFNGMMTLRVNGLEVYKVRADFGPPGRLAIGRFGKQNGLHLTELADFDISAIGAWSRVLSDAEISDLESRLNAKYNLWGSGRSEIGMGSIPSKPLFFYQGSSFDGGDTCKKLMEFNPRAYARTASSVWNNEGLQSYHNNGGLESGSAWCAGKNLIGEWYGMDLDVQYHVAGILIQGRGDHTQYVTSFKVMFSEDNSKWHFVDGGKVFAGNTDRWKKLDVKFNTPVFARYIRIYPQTWVEHMSLRAGVLICSGASDDVVMNPDLGRRWSSSVWNNDWCYTRAQLDSVQGWSAQGHGWGQWHTMDLTTARMVTGVVTQDRNNDCGCWQMVTAYSVSVSIDNVLWTAVDDDAVFTYAQWRVQSPVLFSRPYLARFVRIIVKNWYHHPSMRAGVLIGKSSWYDSGDNLFNGYPERGLPQLVNLSNRGTNFQALRLVTTFDNLVMPDSAAIYGAYTIFLVDAYNGVAPNYRGRTLQDRVHRNWLMGHHWGDFGAHLGRWLFHSPSAVGPNTFILTVVTFTSDGRVTARVNGRVVAQRSNSGMIPPGLLVIGNAPGSVVDGSQFSNCDVAAVGAWNRVLSDAEIAALEYHLNKQYGLWQT